MDEGQFIHELFVRLIEEKVGKRLDFSSLHLPLSLSESSRLSIPLCKTFFRQSTVRSYRPIDVRVLFQSIIDYLGYEEMGNEFEENFYQLCQDTDWKIRSTMPLTIIDVSFVFVDRSHRFRLFVFQLGQLENQRESTFLSIVWNGFLTLLNDTHGEVMFAVAKNLREIFQIFSRDPTDGLLNGAISSEASVR